MDVDGGGVSCWSRMRGVEVRMRARTGVLSEGVVGVGAAVVAL